MKINAKKNNAFTLAEVLLTLVIVGIIAALTIPALLVNVQKQQYVAGFNKTYSFLNELRNKIILDKGSLEGNLGINTNQMINTFGQYLTYSKICLAGQNIGECFHDGASAVKTLHGGNWNVGTINEASAKLTNGMIFFLSGPNPNCNGAHFTKNGTNQSCIVFYIDQNGFSSPNTYGRDIWVFVMAKDGVYPYGTQIGGSGYDPTACNPLVTTNIYNGVSCGAKIVTEGGMNY